jgi:serine phosphatase RsbU (regulator of sigma subunit)
MPPGLMPDQAYQEGEVTLLQQDAVLFYTDGLVEAHDPNRQMFGFPRLKRLLQDRSQKDGMIDYLLKELEEFTGADWDQEDDVTLVMLRKIP